MRTFASRAAVSRPKLARRAEGRSRTSSEARESATSDRAAPKITFDFARIPLYAPTSQARLEVGSAADSHERQANRVAEETAGNPARAADHPSRLQLTQTVVPSSEAAPAIDIRPALQSSGQALDPRTRAVMESRLGRDFRDVRVHTGTAAADSARSLSASAYTFGRDIVFAGGEYAPTAAGLWLLAHELTHVVQQRTGEPVIQCGPGPGKDHPAKSSTAKGDTRISTLRAKVAEVQFRLHGLSGAQGWRGEFHASSDEKMQQIQQLSREWQQAEDDWQESQAKFHIFERAETPEFGKKLDRLYNKISGAYWQNRNASEAEKQYESESAKKEAALLTQQAAIMAEVGKLGKPGTLSQSQYDSLLARLTELTIAADQLWNAEIQAQIKFTGSGPVSPATPVKVR